MSYDVIVGQKSYNFTYNLGPFFREFIPCEATGEVGIFYLAGKRGKEVASLLNEALERITTELHKQGQAPFLRKYNAANGWGDTLGAIMFLALIASAAGAKPRCIVKVI